MNGFVDLQVNGYAGVDFNADEAGTEAFRAACERLRADGVSQILATIITDELSAMERRLGTIVRARRADAFVRSVIMGIHIEGPFLNPEPGYIGAHPAAHAIEADVESMERLLEASDGLTRIVTLAPERDPGGQVTRALTDRGIVVSAGHCNPSLDQLAQAIDAGLGMFTHLGNGCPRTLDRHDNIIQRVLGFSSKLAIGFIADGVHVPLFALGNYLRAAGDDRAFVVTDAIAAAGQGPGEFRLGGQTVVVDEHLATWSADRSHLVGSASTMRQSADNLRSVGLSSEQIDRLTRINPLAALGGDRLD